MHDLAMAALTALIAALSCLGLTLRIVWVLVRRQPKRPKSLSSSRRAQDALDRPPPYNG